MSKQTGLIRLDGKIGGISFYKLGGEDLARIANGPSKDKIQNDANFKRTRENNNEFGGSAIVAKALRLAFANILPTMADSRLTSRLVKLLKEINLKGTGTRGERPFKLTDNEVMLLNFELNKNTSLGSVFNSPFSYSNVTARNEASVVIPAFVPGNYVEAPSGATHFRVVMSIGVLSDYAFDPASKRYEPLDANSNLMNTTVYSNVFALNDPSVSATLTATLNGSPTLSGDQVVIQMLGIEFFQRIGTTDYLFAQGNAMKIINVF